MKHTVVIWSKTKIADAEGNKKYAIECRSILTEKDIEQLALSEFLDSNSRLRDDREYFAEIESTTHD